MTRSGARPRDLPGPAAPHGGGRRGAAACCSSTIPRRPTPMPRPRRSPRFARIYWIAGGRPKEGGIASLVDFFPRIAKAYLIGEAADGFRRDPRRRGAGRHGRDAGRRRSRAAAVDAAADPAAESGRAAVAGVRVLRPVPEFRAARRRVPRARPRAQRGRQPRGRPPDGQPGRSQPICRVVVDGGPGAARGGDRPDGRRRRPVARGEPGGRRAPRATTASISSSARSPSSCRRSR